MPLLSGTIGNGQEYQWLYAQASDLILQTSHSQCQYQSCSGQTHPAPRPCTKDNNPRVLSVVKKRVWALWKPQSEQQTCRRETTVVANLMFGWPCSTRSDTNKTLKRRVEFFDFKAEVNIWPLARLQFIGADSWAAK